MKLWQQDAQFKLADAAINMTEDYTAERRNASIELCRSTIPEDLCEMWSDIDCSEIEDYVNAIYTDQIAIDHNIHNEVIRNKIKRLEMMRK